MGLPGLAALFSALTASARAGLSPEASPYYEVEVPASATRLDPSCKVREVSVSTGVRLGSGWPLHTICEDICPKWNKSFEGERWKREDEGE